MTLSIYSVTFEHPEKGRRTFLFDATGGEEEAVVEKLKLDFAASGFRCVEHQLLKPNARVKELILC